MPLFKTIHINNDTTVFLWEITEDFNELFRQASLKDTSLARMENMKSESHQKGFLSVRMLLQHCGYTDFDLFYDEFGKPHLNDGTHISISHSFDFSAIALSRKNIGIDIEQIKEKVLRIAPRFMEMWHLENLSPEDQTKKATVIWGTKEAIFKVKNEVGISFSDHIFEKDFLLSDKICKAELHFNNQIENFDICFEEIIPNGSNTEKQNYMLICARHGK
ncbi:4'-phosphopantetheinyl transferase superfamily protein [Flavobacterium amniphilum]|uniref:4'-phosphopantetheinyl transferase family protein n=1 Tax=Flavobacterium amniphilum TaxID=1834035 RepID=UPI002029F57A|nr:4'-phosphopantetheinyl transferase superfamily protein [Flavobacterium amniphilum]MCL9806051.1 4'-phosphopantetheinyl transferase superfamily protein [Flavobacterium amniphilum]